MKRLKKTKSKLLTWTLALGLSFSVPTLHSGDERGGGGDNTEAQIYAIRKDLLEWVLNNNAKQLSFPSTLKYETYYKEMIAILTPHRVVLGAIASDENLRTAENELNTWVKGIPKICRGFISKKDNKPHIICDSGRFSSISIEDQYLLIHHEYAGLTEVEKNQGASSEYQISIQIKQFVGANKRLLPASAVIKAKQHILSGESLKKNIYFDTHKAMGLFSYEGNQALDIEMETGFNEAKTMREFFQNEGSIEKKLLEDQSLIFGRLKITAIKNFSGFLGTSGKTLVLDQSDYNSYFIRVEINKDQMVFKICSFNQNQCRKLEILSGRVPSSLMNLIEISNSYQPKNESLPYQGAGTLLNFSRNRNKLDIEYKTYEFAMAPFYLFLGKNRICLGKEILPMGCIPYNLNLEANFIKFNQNALVE